MKTIIVTTTIILALGLSGTAAQASVYDGGDLLIINNGDGSDFMESFGNRFWRFFGYR